MDKPHAEALLNLMAECFMVLSAPDPIPPAPEPEPVAPTNGREPARL